MNPNSNSQRSNEPTDPMSSMSPETLYTDKSTPEEDQIALKHIGELEAEDNPSNAALFAEQESKLQSEIKPVVEPAIELEPIADPVAEPEIVVEPESVVEPEVLPEPLIPDPVVESEPGFKFETEPDTIKTTDSLPEKNDNDNDVIPAAELAPLSAAIAGVLNEKPKPLVTTEPQPEKKKSSKKPLIVLIILLVSFAAGGAGYFIWQAQQQAASSETTTPAEENKPVAAPTPEPTDTNASVTESADSVEAYADGVNDSAYSDDSLSDAVLYAN
jgi:hypothetical protein